MNQQEVKEVKVKTAESEDWRDDYEKCKQKKGIQHFQVVHGVCSCLYDSSMEKLTLLQD